MSTLFIRNPRLLAMALAMIIVGGLSAFQAIPRLEDPVIVNRFAQLITPFPGAGAERVEALVTEKLEAELRKVAEIKNIFSSSRNGLSFINIELRDSVTNVEDVWSRIRDKIEDARTNLPAGSGRPDFDSDRTYAFTLISALQWDLPGKPNRSILRRYGLELQDRLRNAGGTALVRLYGAPKEEILVSVNAARLASVRLTARDVATAITNADAKVSAGQLRNRNNTIQFEVKGALKTLDRIRRIPIRTGRGGTIIRVGDVATIKRTVASPPDQLVISQGKPAILVAARMEFNLRVDSWSQGIRKVIRAFEKELPEGLKLNIIYDQNTYTEDRLSTLLVNLLIGAGLVVFVLLITLGWRNALIVAATLPLTTLVALTCLNMFGIPIHQMSVTGLIVALGLLVDNAIVMTDLLRSKRIAGIPMLKAVDQAVRHLWVPLAASTLTTILAFMPIILLPGPTGEFVGAIGIGVSIALVTSYLLSLTVIPALAGLFMKIGSDPKSQRWWRTGIRLPRVSKLFRWTLAISLRHPWKSILAASSIPVLGFVAAGNLTEQFFPPADRDQFHIEMTLPGSSSILHTREVVKRAENLLRKHKSIQSVHWSIGRSFPSFYYNLLSNKDGLASYAQAMIKASSITEANRLILALQKEFDRAFPGVQTLVRRLEQGPPFDAPLEVRIYGPDLQKLRTLGEKFRGVVASLPSITHTRLSLASGAPKIWFRIDEDKARLAGLRLVDVARQLNFSLEGLTSGTVVQSTEVLPVRIRAGDRSKIEKILSLTFMASSRSGTVGNDFQGIPLTALGTISLEPVLRVIPRRNGLRVNTVKGYLKSGVLPQTALTSLKTALAKAKLNLPDGYRVEFGGEAEKRNESVSKLAASVGLIVMLMIAVVVLSFNSFRLGLVIFVVALYAMGLGLLSLSIFDYPLGFVVIIGVMGLVGLAINAAIIITAALKSNERASAADANAIGDIVVNDTSRHILSTTITTVGGFLPLILAEGGFWPPFAIAIAGGTVMCTVISFYFVPACFLLNARALARRKERKEGSEALAAST